MANFDRRQRGRFSSRRNGRRQNGSSRPSQVIKLNDNGSFNQRIKFNGNAGKLFEKYNKLASEALSIGDNQFNLLCNLLLKNGFRIEKKYRLINNQIRCLVAKKIA